MNKKTNKIAYRDMILGTLARTIIPDDTDALVRFADRGLIVEFDKAGRRGFYLKWVDEPCSKARSCFEYKVQLRKEDIEALLSSDYDHLVIHLGGTSYPFCILDRSEFLRMRLSVGGCIVVTYERGYRKFRVTGGTVTMNGALLIELRRFWHNAVKDPGEELTLAKAA